MTPPAGASGSSEAATTDATACRLVGAAGDEGLSVSVRCPDCGCVEPPWSVFCWRCGAVLDDESEPPSPASAVAADEGTGE